MDWSLWKSRTFWTLLLTFAFNAANETAQLLPAPYQMLVNGILAALTAYFHVNPSQQYNPMVTDTSVQPVQQTPTPVSSPFVPSPAPISAPISAPIVPVVPTPAPIAIPTPTPVPPAPAAPAWSSPVPAKYFVVSQPYLNEDWTLYPKFGHHTGVDYGGHGQTGIPLFACADGEIIYRDVADSAWGASLGNHAALYVPSVGQSFLYCHMASMPPMLGPVKAGQQIGVMGNTGKAAGGAIHLHLEGFHGQFVIAWRQFTSLDDITTKTFDADQYIRGRLG